MQGLLPGFQRGAASWRRRFRDVPERFHNDCGRQRGCCSTRSKERAACPLPLRSKLFLGNCFRIVKAQKISRGCAAHVCGSPFAPNAVPAPVYAAALTKSRYHVRTAHAVVKVQLSRKEKYRHAVQAKNFVGVKRRQNDRVCCGAVRSFWAVIR